MMMTYRCKKILLNPSQCFKTGQRLMEKKEGLNLSPLYFTLLLDQTPQLQLGVAVTQSYILPFNRPGRTLCHR